MKKNINAYLPKCMYVGIKKLCVLVGIWCWNLTGQMKILSVENTCMNNNGVTHWPCFHPDRWSVWIMTQKHSHYLIILLLWSYLNMQIRYAELADLSINMVHLRSREVIQDTLKGTSKVCKEKVTSGDKWRHPAELTGLLFDSTGAGLAVGYVTLVLHIIVDPWESP